MCVVSMVHDTYFPKFDPWINPVVPLPMPTSPPMDQIQIVPTQFDELRKLIEDYRKALEAAKVVDRLTGQPDCVDPEKAVLEKRVAELEKKVEEMTKEYKRVKRKTRSKTKSKKTKRTRK